MFKWVSWVAKVGATALLLSFLCIWTTGYIVNSYMETVVKQLELPIETQPFALSGVWGRLWGAEKSPVAEAAQESSDKEQLSVSAEQGQEEQNQVQDGQKQENQSQSLTSDNETIVSPEPSEEAEVSVTQNNDEEDIIPALSDQIKLPQLTDDERQGLYALVVSKLNSEQLKQLSGSLQDGLTADELVKLQSMLKSALTESEYAQMMELLAGKQQTAVEDKDTLEE